MRPLPETNCSVGAPRPGTSTSANRLLLSSPYWPGLNSTAIGTSLSGSITAFSSATVRTPAARARRARAGPAGRRRGRRIPRSTSAGATRCCRAACTNGAGTAAAGAVAVGSGRGTGCAAGNGVPVRVAVLAARRRVRRIGAGPWAAAPAARRVGAGREAPRRIGSSGGRGRGGPNLRLWPGEGARKDEDGRRLPARRFAGSQPGDSLLQAGRHCRLGAGQRPGRRVRPRGLTRRPLRRGRVVEEGRRRRSRGLADDQGGCRDERRRLPAGRGQWSRWRARSGTAACPPPLQDRPTEHGRDGRRLGRVWAARVERRLPGRDGRRPAPAHDRGERRRRDAEGFGESGRGR